MFVVEMPSCSQNVFPLSPGCLMRLHFPASIAVTGSHVQCAVWAEMIPVTYNLQGFSHILFLFNYLEWIQSPGQTCKLLIEDNGFKM